MRGPIEVADKVRVSKWPGTHGKRFVVKLITDGAGPGELPRTRTAVLVEENTRGLRTRVVPLENLVLIEKGAESGR